ncbi:MAG TPA: protein kinase, partial [Terriglobales bacterium]|nr:protein kinase [Terriglobales bacterium]
ALEADEGRRAAVLEESCAGDEVLRREVESLLAQHENAGDFIETPAFEAEASTVGEPPVPSAVKPRPNLTGSLFGQYRIVEEIGVGGMGVVYKAEDTKLGRPVALKFLPQGLAADHVALARFRREARAASALNHPNICTIYDIVEGPGPVFIAMEYMEGQTLAGCMGGRALDAERITKFGMAIAEALGAAHAKGVIHRDIKPGNVFVTTSGLVKVLDFGVAKLLRIRDGPTATSVTKTEGVTGTLPYMSPEQLRGRDVDARSDIYSLGVVLYEMSTGRRPYAGDLQSELIDSILNRPASPPRTNNPKLSSKLEEIILKCLEKDPEDRYQTAKEIAVDLRRMSAPSATTTPAVTRGAKPRSRVLLLAAAGAICLGLAALWFFSPVRQPRVTGSTRITHDSVLKCCMVTDGSRIYFVQILNGGTVLMQVSAAGGESSAIPTPIRDPMILDISPDHAQLLVRTRDDKDTPFWILPLPAGSPRQLGNLVGQEARWSPDGRQLVFHKGSDLYLAKADGAEPRLLKSFHGRTGMFPYFSPDGSRVRFTVTWPGSLWEINANGSNLHQLLAGWHDAADNCCGRWTADGRYYVFWSDALSGGEMGDIFAHRESGGLLHRAAAAPARLTFGPIGFDYSNLLPSADGRKLFVQGMQERSELVRYDAGYKQFVPFLAGVSAEWAGFSRDGKWIAYSSVPEGILWRSRVDGGERIQLTTGSSISPQWSPDGTRIAYGDGSKVFLIPAEGGSPEQLLPEDIEEYEPTWSADGTRLAFGRGTQGDGNQNIEIVEMKTRQASTLPGSTGLHFPRWSPDGRYLAALTSDDKKLVLYNFTTQKWSNWVASPGGLDY